MTTFISADYGDILLPADQVVRIDSTQGPGHNGVPEQLVRITPKNGEDIVGRNATIRQIIPANPGIEVVTVAVDDVDLNNTETWVDHYPVVAWDVGVAAIDITGYGGRTSVTPIAVDCPFGSSNVTWLLHEPATGRAWAPDDATYGSLAEAIRHAASQLRGLLRDTAQAKKQAALTTAPDA